MSLNNFDDDKRTAIHIAAINNRADIIQIILNEEEADVNAVDKLGKWALYHAVETNKPEISQQLVDCKRIWFDTKLPNGQTILFIAATKNMSGFVDYLFNHIKNHPEEQSDPHRRADLNVKDKDGKTAFHIAAQKGNTDVLKKFVEYNKKFDVNLVDSQNRTALHWAAATNRQSIVAFLLSLPNIDVNVKDVNGRTPAFLAADGKFVASFQEIVQSPSFDPNVADRDGSTLIMYLAQRGFADLAEILCKRDDVDVNCTDKLNRTPLIIAVECKKNDMVKFLISNEKVDVNRVNTNGRTALHIALMGNNEEAGNAIINCSRSKVNIKDKQGKYPCDYTKNKKIIKKLEQISKDDMRKKSLSDFV